MELSLCAEFHIPHSTFLSWSAEDRAKALAFQIEKGERCTLCGTAPWEWEDNKFAYEAGEHFCRGCYIKNVASEGQGRLPGTTVELVRSTPQQKAKAQLREQARARKRDEEE